MPTIVYLHGFNSAPQSVKGQMLARAAAALARSAALSSAATAPSPRAGDAGRPRVDRPRGAGGARSHAHRQLARRVLCDAPRREVRRARRADQSRDPAATTIFARTLGRQRNLYTGEEYEVTPAHFAELAALAVARITRPERYFLLVRTGDELLDWREAVAFYAGAYQYVAGGGDHGWTDFGDEVASVLRFAGCG